MHKLGIIVPYRDRSDQLERFLKCIKEFFRTKNLSCVTIVSEQMDELSFNRGALLNIGFLKAKELGCDYVAFHDVDMLPTEDVNYEYEGRPIQLANSYLKEKHVRAIDQDIPDDYFGGVTLVPVSDFEKVNGYSNEYWGWGFEDNDLLRRFWEAKVPLETITYRQPIGMNVGIDFNGVDSYVYFKNIVDLQKPVSFYVTYKAEAPRIVETEISDEGSIFSIPGLDTTLAYDSFGTYKFETFDNYEDVYSIHTKKYPEMFCRSIITVDPVKRKVIYYQNGSVVGFKKWNSDRFLRNKSKRMYLGVGNPERDSRQKWFKGQICEFAIFDRVLGPKEIRDLQINDCFSLLTEIGDYSPEGLSLYYDAKFVDRGELVDLTGNNNSGILRNCSQVRVLGQECRKELVVPERRYGKFILQQHDKNGAEEGYWKDWKTRENQIRYRKVCLSGTNYEKEGLSTLKDTIRIQSEDIHDIGRMYKIKTYFKEKE